MIVFLGEHVDLIWHHFPIRFHYYSGVKREPVKTDAFDSPGCENQDGIRDNVMLIWEELDRARNILSEVQTIIAEYDQHYSSKPSKFHESMNVSIVYSHWDC